MKQIFNCWPNNRRGKEKVGVKHKEFFFSSLVHFCNMSFHFLSINGKEKHQNTGKFFLQISKTRFSMRHVHRFLLTHIFSSLLATEKKGSYKGVFKKRLATNLFFSFQTFSNQLTLTIRSIVHIYLRLTLYSTTITPIVVLFFFFL